MRTSRDRGREQSEHDGHHPHTKGDHFWVFLQYGMFTPPPPNTPAKPRRMLGLTPEERGFVPNAEDKSDGLRSPFVFAIQPPASREDRTVLRAGYDLQVLYEADHGDKTRLAARRSVYAFPR